MAEPLPHPPELQPAFAFFQQQKWQPFLFQQQAWSRFLKGESCLVNAPTGSGKTYSVWLGCLLDYLRQSPAQQQAQRNKLQVLWITPLRALTTDIQRAMQFSAQELGVPWQVALRTGDTSSAERQKQKRSTPECLITTPESLQLMIAQKGYPEFFSSLKVIVVDEWHELMGSKRGVQMELALARLRAVNKQLRCWAISATIGNLAEAVQVLLGPQFTKEQAMQQVVRAKVKKDIVMETVLPKQIDRFPWAGHMGLRTADLLLPVIEQAETVLLFTNTRAQSELWYHKLLELKPELAGLIAMHHGSLDRELREWVESAIHQGQLKVVVCTSSLDLGVDFRPVDTVIQVGSPKGIARFLQRAGRSGHRPGAKSRIFFLPTHAIELLEASALKQAVHEVVEGGKMEHMEQRLAIQKPLDVLVQYLVTLSVSEGFTDEGMYAELKATYAYRNLTRSEWEWCLQLITTGGDSLSAYDEYVRVHQVEGSYHIVSRRAALNHRLNMGTIVSEPSVKLKFKNGSYIGTVEEYMVSKLKPGNMFWFGGMPLELVQVQQLTAIVKRSNKTKGTIASWVGGRLPLSSEMSELIREKLNGAMQSKEPELVAMQPILELQQQWSAVPKYDELLIEQVQSDEGYHVFFFPFQGRVVHEIMSSLLAYRISQLEPLSLSIAMNDYGFELLSETPIPLLHALEMDLFTTDNLLTEVQYSLNNSEMAKRRFREIAQISGLILQKQPGFKERKSKHLQANTTLLFEVFEQYDPENLLIKQAYNEVMDVQLEQGRLERALLRMQQQKLVLTKPPRPTPFAFPILVDRMRDQVSSETLEQRITRMQLQLEDYAVEQGFVQ